MKIGEAAKLTGLTVSNIRFYERKGLLEPEREAENDYRNYSEKDVEQLKKILFYRKMNISVDHISLLLQGKISMREAVEITLKNLYSKQEELQGSIELCEKVLAEKEMGQLNVDTYLEYVKEEEEKGTRFGEMEEFLEELADYTQMSRFRGDPYIGRLFENRWVARILAVLFMVILFLGPVLFFVEAAAEGRKITAAGILIWLVLILVMAGGFIYDLKRRKR